MAANKRRRADRYYVTRGMYGTGAMAKNAGPTYLDLGQAPAGASDAQRTIFNAILQRGINTMPSQTYGSGILSALQSVPSTPAASATATTSTRDPLSVGSFMSDPTAFADEAERRYKASPWYARALGNLRAGASLVIPAFGVGEGIGEAALGPSQELGSLERVSAPIAQARSISQLRGRARKQDQANFTRLISKGMPDVARRIYPELASVWLR